MQVNFYLIFNQISIDKQTLFAFIFLKKNKTLI